MPQPAKVTTTGEDSAVHLHSKEKGLLRVPVFRFWTEKADKWFERGVKEATVNDHC